MNNNRIHPYIRAWGQLLGSYDYYIAAQVELAIRDRAPPKAIYRDTDGRWHTFDDIVGEDNRARITRIVAQLEANR